MNLVIKLHETKIIDRFANKNATQYQLQTCLASRYCHNEFSRQYFPTAGVDFFLKRTMLSGSRNITLKIWDVGGQALSGNMLDKYVFGADVILLIYDVTNIISFQCLEDWMEAVRRITLAQDLQPTVTLVGNKCDMEHQRTVRIEKQIKFAQENGISSHNLSARTGENVSITFQKIVAEALGLRLTRAELEEQHTVMKAEIVATVQPEHVVCRNIPVQQAKSSVCEIQ